MKKEEDLPFASALEALFTRDPLPIHLLHRLSDMTAEEMATFQAGWTAVPTPRRRIIIRHLTDLTEDNYVVDFGPVFRDCLHDPDEQVRVAALDGMWDVTDMRLISPIVQLMQHDPVEDVRVAAAAALGHFVMLVEWGQLPERFAPPLITALLAEYENQETPLPLRRATLEALGAASHPRIAHLIDAAYESGDEELQISAVFAMGASADKRWLTTVLGEMDSPDPEMRAEAARASGQLGSSDAVTHLERLVADEDIEVQLAAIVALGRIGGDMAHNLLLRLADEEEDSGLLEAVDEALEELSLFAGEFKFLDYDEEEEEEGNP
ncbi:MAG TPA: HEAT repeat domain-containing protein [Chloroflexota bacterium]|nr:HEAT repeat domain-containing protein [Chloroflexota bacterium]HUM71390.1 HEAT repeat domain-containing protein [Chloroflexota bacterium]